MARCNTPLAIFFGFFWYAVLLGQHTIEVDGIFFSYSIERDSIECDLRAKTKGWIGIGFNSKNSIVGSDLLLFNIVGGEPSCTDLYVKSAGNPKKDSELGGENSIQILSSKEDGSHSRVRFSIPLNSRDPYDFVHEIGKEIWLILAYSIADDFEHHSRVRRHTPFKLEHPN